MTAAHPTDSVRPGARAKRLIRARLLRLGLALGLALVLVDIALRLLFGLGNPVLYQRDPACGYLPVPNQHVWRFFCHNDINAYSMRSPEFPAIKPAGSLRIMFIGDSVTYGTTHIDQSKIFTSLIARDLPTQLHRGVEVLNASAGAWAPANEAGYLKSRGTFHADVVIFVLNTGDLDQPFEPGQFSSAGGYPDHKPLCALSEVWERYVWPRLTYAVASDAGSLASSSPRVSEVLPSVLASLAEANSLVTRSGASFGIVYSPSRGGYWENATYAGGLRTLRHWAQDQGIPFLDLTAFYAPCAPKDIYQDGIHLREKGNEVAARAIEQQWKWPALSN
jgi:lysophospholipase L1-like esterase